MTDLTLIGKPGCHLCDVAGAVVEQVIEELPDAVADSIRVTELSILDDPQLYDQWWEKIPVILIDGSFHGQWRVEPERLRDALLSADAVLR